MLAVYGSCDIESDLEMTIEIYDELKMYKKVESALLNSGESKTYAECIVEALKAEDPSEPSEVLVSELKMRIGIADELCRIKEYWIPLIVGLVLLICAILCCCCVLDVPCSSRKVSFEELEHGNLERMFPIINL